MSENRQEGSNFNGSSDSSPEEEDQDEPSISTVQETVADDMLSSFREKWQQELKISPKKPVPVLPKAEVDFESEAKALFLKGGEMERDGKMYEAIQYYRRAVQLVPDIDVRLRDLTKTKPTREINVPDEIEDAEESEEDQTDEDDDTEIKEGELLCRIQKKVAKICIPKIEQKSTHISVLPMEMMLYILRWLVSPELDLLSLEIFSRVCRGFYVCARDSEVWRLACLRVWGLNCGSSPHNYLSWRHMYVERTRVQFNGCYIGKITYIRHGETSFQDQTYRPWHLVVYYRYLRFFPDGVVLVLTSADEPTQCVGQMKNRNARGSVLKGYYRLNDDKVTLVVQRHEENKLIQAMKKTKRKGGVAELHEAAQQTFRMEFQIRSGHKKNNMQLVWTHYSVLTRTLKGDESTCTFDLVANRFPPLWFSRVKSYTSESECPLQ